MPNSKRSRSPEESLQPSYGYAIVPRDNNYEHEQRPLQRETSERISPSQVVPYSEFRARQLQNKLKDDDHATVMEAMHVLLTWLKQGDCNKDNAEYFFELIQTMSQNCPKLVHKKGKLEKRLHELDSVFDEQSTLISSWLNDVCLLFQTVQDCPTVWESLTENQRQEIEVLKQRNLEENILSHSEEIDGGNEIKHAEEYHEENSKQLLPGAAENKKITKSDLKRLKEKNARLVAKYNIELAKKKRLLKQRDERVEAFGKVIHSMEDQIDSLEQEVSELKFFKEQNEARLNEGNQHGDRIKLSQHEARLLCLTANYLNVLPLGAEVDDICSYLQQADPNIKSNDLENFLRKFPIVFKEQSTNDVTGKKNWKYVGFNSHE